jgi:hypothetical protein
MMFVSSWGWIGSGYAWQIEPADMTMQAIGLILILGAFVLYTAILWKVTSHWLESRHQQAAEEDGATDDGQANDGQTGDGQANDGQTGDRQVEDSDR